jgi:hypothetical protein
LITFFIGDFSNAHKNDTLDGESLQNVPSLHFKPDPSMDMMMNAMFFAHRLSTTCDPN